MKTLHQTRVEQFMSKCGQDVPEHPILPAQHIRKLRAALVLEEALELVAALGFTVRIPVSEPSPKDGMPITPRNLDIQPLPYYPLKPDLPLEDILAPIADGCADLSVVVTGALTACGLPDSPFLDAVDENNLAKLAPPACPCTPESPAAMRLINGLFWSCPKCEKVLPKEHGPFIRSDGKLVKPLGHKPPDLASIIRGLLPLPPVTS